MASHSASTHSPPRQQCTLFSLWRVHSLRVRSLRVHSLRVCTLCVCAPCAVGQVVGPKELFGERDVGMVQPRLGGGRTHAWVISYLHVRWLARADFERLRVQYPRIMTSIRLWILWRGVKHFLVQNYRSKKYGTVGLSVRHLPVGLAVDSKAPAATKAPAAADKKAPAAADTKAPAAADTKVPDVPTTPISGEAVPVNAEQEDDFHLAI